MIVKIISGGQTGVDRAALDFAIAHNISNGGWCPKGRLDENGELPEKYNHLIEVNGNFKDNAENYAARTVANIIDSDATLVILPSLPLPDEIKDGTLLTLNELKSQGKPYLLISLLEAIEQNISLLAQWLKINKVKVLNIAGPRESSSPGIYESSLSFLEKAFYRCF